MMMMYYALALILLSTFEAVPVPADPGCQHVPCSFMDIAGCVGDTAPQRSAKELMARRETKKHARMHKKDIAKHQQKSLRSGM